VKPTARCIEKRSALEGRTVRPLRGREDEGGRRPWAAGTEGVPLATATQRDPFGGWDGDRNKRKARSKGDPALRNPTHQAARLWAVSDFLLYNTPVCEIRSEIVAENVNPSPPNSITGESLWGAR